jgi:glycerol kinase
MSSFFLIIDQGTSGTKSFLFDVKGKIYWRKKIKHSLNRPHPLHIEANPQTIANGVKNLIRSAVIWTEKHQGRILSIGLAVQRSTFLFWDKDSTTPLTPALSWQDNRAHRLTENFAKQKQYIYKKTGIPLSGHFGALKYVYLIEEFPELRPKINSGKTFFGPLSSYLIHTLTGIPVVDHSIAGRSQLFSLDSLRWDKTLCELFNIQTSSLPLLVPTVHKFGNVTFENQSIPISCVIGDQQAALMGQRIADTGILAMNLGTSGSVQYYSGNKPIFINGLMSNLFWSSKFNHQFLLEGTINACNSLFYWLENHLNIPHEKMIWDKRCIKTTTNGALIPGFTGITSPYWVQPEKSIFYNLEIASNNEIIRAGMESIGFLVYDIIQALKRDEHKISVIHASGGGAREPLLQFIADLLGIPIKLSHQKDKTALGVFQLLYKNQFGEFLNIARSFQKEFSPKMTDFEKKGKLEIWEKALANAGIK